MALDALCAAQMEAARSARPLPSLALALWHEALALLTRMCTMWLLACHHPCAMAWGALELSVSPLNADTLQM